MRNGKSLFSLTGDLLASSRTGGALLVQVSHPA